MEINFNAPYNSQSFGMAFIKPSCRKGIAMFQKIGEADIDLYPEKLIKRGMKQIKSKQKNNRFFDIILNNRYNQREGAFEVVRRDNGEVAATYPLKDNYKRGFCLVESRLEGKYLRKYADQTKPFSKMQKMKFIIEYYLKSLGTYLFKPQDFVNPALRSASDKALELESQEMMALLKGYKP